MDRVADAVDFAYALGLMKYAAPGRLSHAPFALTPAPIDPASHAALESLTAASALLALRVARDGAFLQAALAEAAQADEFTAWLLALSRAVPPGTAQPLELLISRNDFFRVRPAAEQAPLLRQVEFNAIAASYPGLAGLTHVLHAALWPELRPRLAANDPLVGVCAALGDAFRRYGRPEAAALMIVQAGETNVFDQRLVELGLARQGIPLRRVTLDELAQEGRLREGRLVVSGQVCAMAYLRAGYAPEDLATPAARQGRTLLEHSDAVVVPRVALQLAGTKKMQQLLSGSETLRRYLDADTARRLQDTFAGLYGLDELVSTPAGEQPAWRAALAAPQRYVLKPQREGGGNNFYDEGIGRVLGTATARERAGYILMERIHPIPHDAVLVRDGAARRAACVSEIGRFGVLLADGESIAVNQDVGYLVRTREQHLREGGISAGFGHLDSLQIEPAPS